MLKTDELKNFYLKIIKAQSCLTGVYNVYKIPHKSLNSDLDQEKLFSLAMYDSECMTFYSGQPPTVYQTLNLGRSAASHI